jgi:tetratricopeptide (TPR) repeat protein
MARAVSDHGGIVESFLGDGVLALFGLPEAHEDDPRRAIQAALDIREGVRQLGRQTTAGINTGEAYIGPAATSDQGRTAVRGRVINLAARIQAKAGPGQIIVGDATRRQARGAFDFAPLSLELKGVSRPVPAWEVLRALPRPGKVRGLEGVRAPLCGRDDELQALLSAAHAVRNGSGSAVAVIGDAGVGKSRLLTELRTRIGDAMLWLEGRCSEAGTATSYLPFVNMLGEHFALPPDAATGDRPAAVTSSVGQLVAAGDLAPDRQDEMCAVIGHLLGVGAAEGSSRAVQHATPSELKNLTFAAVRDLLSALGRRVPATVILEDLHWADSLSIELAAFLLQSLEETSLLLVLVSRRHPDHHWRRLGKLATRTLAAGYTELQLHELGSEASGELFDTLVSSRTAGTDLRRAILSRAQGNPFFLEELLRSLVDTHALAPEDAGRQTAGAALAVPDSVQNTIMSRFDRLDAELKVVLQTAAVIGKTFARDVLSTVLHASPGLDEALWELERREFIDQDLVLPQVQYVFKHVLTQETIYRSIPRHRRAPLHAAVGGAIEQVFQRESVGHAESLAFHYDRSDDDGKAITYLHVAGDRSRRAYLNEDAIDYYERALRRLARTDEAGLPSGKQTAQIHESLGDVLQLTGRHDEALNAYAGALAGHPEGDRIERSRLHRKVGVTRQTQRRFNAAIEAFDAADEALGQPPLNAGRAWFEEWLETQDARATLLYWRSDQPRLRHLLDEVKPVVERYGTTRQQARFWSSLAIMLIQRDRYVVSDEAFAHVRKAVGASREVGDLGVLSSHLFGLGFAQLWRRELDDAEGNMLEALQISEKTGDLTRRSRCLSYLVVAARFLGRVDDAAERASESLTIAEQAELAEYVAMAQANLAWVAWRREALSEAERMAQIALETWSGLHVFGPLGYPFDWMARWPLIGVAHGRGDATRAVRLAEDLTAPGRQLPPAELLTEVERLVHQHRSSVTVRANDLAPLLRLAADLGYL